MVLVHGSINVDGVLTTERLPAGGETVIGAEYALFPGGKGANQAVAAKRLGGRVRFAGKVGADAFGTQMRRVLSGHGLGEHLAASRAEPTGTALIVVAADGESSITVVPGANGTLSPADCAVLDEAAGGDLLLLQNEIPLETSLELLRRARRRGLVTIFNAAPAVRLPGDALGDLDLALVNEHEYHAFFGETLPAGSRSERLDAVARSGGTGVGVVLTLGERGAVGVFRGARAEVAGRRVQAVDATGAGDCFAGALAVALAEGLGLEAALGFANAAASLAVTRQGASASFPSREEVDAL